MYEGERAEIRCELYDVTHGTNRPFNGTWKREGDLSQQPLPSNFRVSYDNILHIEDARVSDSGNYRCTAVAKYEKVYENVQVRVHKREPQNYQQEYRQQQRQQTEQVTNNEDLQFQRQSHLNPTTSQSKRKKKITIQSERNLI